MTEGSSARGETLLRTGKESDAFLAYSRNLDRFPVLSREQIDELAHEYVRTREPTLARKLVTTNLRLVVKLAFEYSRSRQNLNDLVQEGNLGLLRAVELYDPTRGVRLTTYASWWIRAYMLRSIMENIRLVRVGTNQTQRRLFFNLHKEKMALEAKGIVPTDQLLAKRLSVSERHVVDMQCRLGTSELSFDEPVSSQHGRKPVRRVDVLQADEADRPDVSFEEDEFRYVLRARLEIFGQTLEGRDRTIFYDRLLSTTPMPLADFGERYGICRERVRQVEAQLVKRLKEFLVREMGEAVRSGSDVLPAALEGACGMEAA